MAPSPHPLLDCWPQACPQRATEFPGATFVQSLTLIEQLCSRRIYKLICHFVVMATYLWISNAMSPRGQDSKNSFTQHPGW